MAKYPPETCRDCGSASWVWSDREYREGKRRIIVQQPGYCGSDNPLKRAESRERLSAQEPYVDCAAWQPMEREHNA